MKSFARGKVTSPPLRIGGSAKAVVAEKVEVQNISKFGLWLYVAGKEFFLSYDKHPWFKDATVAEISNIEFLFGHHLHWPDLDVDLDLDSLEHPEKYPLMAKHTSRREIRRKRAA